MSTDPPASTQATSPSQWTVRRSQFEERVEGGEDLGFSHGS
jgi:hypothetical protein